MPLPLKPTHSFALGREEGRNTFASSVEIVELIEKEQVKSVDVRFCDVPGVQQHFTVPAAVFADDALENGPMFDGPSIRGFTAIHESNMKFIPDISPAFPDPFHAATILIVNFSIVGPFTDELLSCDPYQVVVKVEAYLRPTDIVDTRSIGAEAEFYLFSDVRYQVSPNSIFFSIDSPEAYRNIGMREEGGNPGYKVPTKGGYFPVSPQDQHRNIRGEMVRKLTAVGLDIERAHHEVGSGGQQEINYRSVPLQKAADDMMKFKYIIKNTALELGYSATFILKPPFGDNGSGMHTYLSLWKNGEPLFYDERGYDSLSDLTRWLIGGPFEYVPVLLAFTNPLVNSFRRLVPGFEAPTNSVYPARNRSACIRIPATGTSPKAKRVEYRVPDPSANPYLSSAACPMAGIDGIKCRIEPATPIGKDLYELPPAEYLDIVKLPSSLEAAPEALREDHEFLTEGDVFTQDLVDARPDYEEAQEVALMRVYPHPSKYQMYYDLWELSVLLLSIPSGFCSTCLDVLRHLGFHVTT